MTTKPEVVEFPGDVLWNGVLIQLLSPCDSTGLVLPDQTWKDKPIQHGLVVQCGEHCQQQWYTGTHVLWRKPGATEFHIGGQAFWLVFESNIVATLSES